MVDYQKQGDIAVLRINNPPVNALSEHVVVGLFDGIDKAVKDVSVRAIVIAGAGNKAFSAGADIREFGKFDPKRGLYLGDACAKIMECPKPVIAAITGVALGGGLEVALSSHYRVAHSGARTGFPEVLIGILPAAFGTQLLPRVVGLKMAMDMITSGRQITAKQATNIGLFDKVVSGDVVSEGIAFAKQVADKPVRKIYEATPKDAAYVAQISEAALSKVAKTKRGVLAPVLCIKAIRGAADLPYKKGVELEADHMRVLLQSGQARALQYAFFAERLATKWQIPGGLSHKSFKSNTINSCGVVGAGTMGSGIAMALMNSGIRVTLVEQNQKFLDRGVAALAGLYAGSVKLGKMSKSTAEKIMKLLTPSTDWQKLKNVDMVVEAVYENLELKKTIFKRLDKICAPKTILCTNTSGLDIDRIAAVTKRPDKVMGTHFFVPAYYMKLLENVRGAKTSPETIATVTEWSTKIGKVPVLVGNCRGFVGNRMLAPYSSEAAFLVEEGCLPHEVDEVIENFGIPIGPFKVADLSGNDIGYSTRQEQYNDMAEKHSEEHNTNRLRFGRRYSPLADTLVEKGRLGRKSGAGWYKYEKPGAKEALVDPWMSKTILDYCRKEGIERRQIAPQEILERCMYSLINEGFKVMEDGIASRPEDIDTIWMLGYGWPRHTGGPMYYASQVGIKRVYDQICHYHRQHPTSPCWNPSKLLARVAASDEPLANWSKMNTSKL